MGLVPPKIFGNILDGVSNIVVEFASQMSVSAQDLSVVYDVHVRAPIHLSKQDPSLSVTVRERISKVLPGRCVRNRQRTDQNTPVLRWTELCKSPLIVLCVLDFRIPGWGRPVAVQIAQNLRSESVTRCYKYMPAPHSLTAVLLGVISCAPEKTVAFENFCLASHFVTSLASVRVKKAQTFFFGAFTCGGRGMTHAASAESVS